jgi:uncharacterized protein (TIGR02118 family)
MATAIALYHTPKDPKAFDSYYVSTHVPLAKKMLGLRSYEINAGPITTPGAKSPYYLIAMLKFDTMSDLQAALASPQGLAVVADLNNFASAGVSMLFFDEQPV